MILSNANVCALLLASFCFQQDYPIEGYTPLTNIMEMHLHLWDCSIDYRPQFYDYRAILTVNTFMLSTTLSSTNNGCTVRFVAEDGTLSIAPQTPAGSSPRSEFRYKNENKITSLPSSELVCVFEFALLEISLRESEKVTEFAPKYDARAAMNGTHLRVCADSCKAFGNLIAYIAAEGDLTPAKESDDENIDSVTSKKIVFLLIDICNCTPMVEFHLLIVFYRSWCAPQKIWMNI